MPNFKKNTSPAMKRSGFKMTGWSGYQNSPVQQEEVVDYQDEYPIADTEKGRDIEGILLRMERDIAERKNMSMEEVGKDQTVQDYLARQKKKLLAE